jgi:hypothetical protein
MPASVLQDAGHCNGPKSHRENCADLVSALPRQLVDWDFDAMTRPPESPPDPAPTASGPRVHPVFFAAAAALVIAIYGVIACTAASETGSRTASEDYYNRLADGLMKGGLSMDLQPPRGLLDLPNPYDRDANLPFRGHVYSPGRLHDVSLYQGKLYLYFSVIPAVALFVPYHWATGGYLSQQQACFLFCSLGFLASALLADSIRRRCFRASGIPASVAATLCVGLVPMVPRGM